jgi:hypothetical protein
MPGRRKTEGKNQRRDVNAGLRVAKALELRAKKTRLVDIAAQCGYASAGACYNAMQRELQRIIVENVEELRREEADGLDKLEAECWKRLEEEGFEKAKLFAVDRILMIKDRRAKLMGLDKRPDELVAQSNYVKKIVIVGGTDEHSND